MQRMQLTKDRISLLDILCKPFQILNFSQCYMHEFAYLQDFGGEVNQQKFLSALKKPF